MAIGTDLLAMLGGEFWAGGAEDEARQHERAALEAILGGGAKGRAGLTPPELERLQAEQLGPSAFESIQSDPLARQAQQDALNNLMRMGRDNGGVETRAAAQMAQMQAQQGARAQQQAALAGLQSRGMGNSGQALAARLQSGSNAANMQAMAGTNAAMDARRQALAALQSGAGLAGQMRGQQFNEQAARAQGTDAISRFNAANRQQANLYNAGLGQQNFQNQVQVAGMANDARMGAADRARNEANRRRGIAHGAAASYGNVEDEIGNVLTGGFGRRG